MMGMSLLLFEADLAYRILFTFPACLIFWAWVLYEIAKPNT